MMQPAAALPALQLETVMPALRPAFSVVQPAPSQLSARAWAAILLGAPSRCSIAELIAAATRDGDGDGLPDFWEQILAERFAPIVYHSSDESAFPANVDWFLQKAELWFYDDDCLPDLHEFVAAQPSQGELVSYQRSGGCGATDTVHSGATRSRGKHRTFYLRDLADEFRSGSPDTREWTTYYHAYPNQHGGVTLQYWRFYPYNDAINKHGGDWEGFHLVLDHDLHPVLVNLLGHTGIEPCAPADCEWEQTHVRIYSEGGGHASRARGGGIRARGGAGFVDPANGQTFVRQETWTNGNVDWFTGQHGKTGTLLNLGAKCAPMNGQSFIQYSGLWGSPGLLYGTSGYWGPAYNETSMAGDFVTAWGDGMQADAEYLRKECYSAGWSR